MYPADPYGKTAKTKATISKKKARLSVKRSAMPEGNRHGKRIDDPNGIGRK